jgi:hypothetical protein
MPTQEGPYSRKDNDDYAKNFQRPKPAKDRDVSKDADRNADVNDGFAGKLKK